MNKKILATAVAVAVSGGMTMSSSAYAGQSAVDGLYGKIRLGIQDAAELSMVSSKLVFGFKGGTDLDNGMRVDYGIELEHDGAEVETPSGTPLTGKAFSNDVSFVALSGDFGKVIAGQHGDLAGYACSGTDLFTFNTDEACSLIHDTRVGDAMQYRYSSGAINLGVIQVFDGTGEGPTYYGAQFVADNFSVGFQAIAASDTAAFSSGVGLGIPAGETGNHVGGHYTFGDITIGVTIADNGQPTNEDATSVALSMPLAGGNFAILSTTGDALDATILGDSLDVEWLKPLGGGAYYGFQFTDDDLAVDSELFGYLGFNF